MFVYRRAPGEKRFFQPLDFWSFVQLVCAGAQLAKKDFSTTRFLVICSVGVCRRAPGEKRFFHHSIFGDLFSLCEYVQVRTQPQNKDKKKKRCENYWFQVVLNILSSPARAFAQFSQNLFFSTFSHLVERPRTHH